MAAIPSMTNQTSSGVGGDFTFDKGGWVLGNYSPAPRDARASIDPGFIIGGGIILFAVVFALKKKG